MPKSRNDRKNKAVYTPPPVEDQPKVSPRWLPPTFIALAVLGIAWIAVFYVTAGQIPVMEQLGNWNLAVGFSGLILSILLATRWH